ncbi:hypothetical protein C8R44DRAFT_881366 [Mycena epipterygia]|nr:hypothetical protein C8R44DRAFT_881366 [Mycena epipterygia]
MQEAIHSPDSATTPQNDLPAQLESTPRIPSASSGGTEGGSDQTGYHAKAEEHVPQGVTSYFKTIKDAESGSPSRRSSRAEPEHDDETASTTTDLTELSTAAQAGSLAPSEISSPTSSHDELEASSDIASPRDNDDAESNASPFMHDDYASARMPSPPQINLAARMQPLAGGEAEHGGVRLCEDEQAKLDDERAEGVRSPAYNDTGPSARFTPHTEDEYSSDEAKEDVEPGGTTKKLVKRLKGEAKVISGRMKRDPDRVEKGKAMMRGT